MPNNIGKSSYTLHIKLGKIEFCTVSFGVVEHMGKKILLVDNDKFYLELIGDLLTLEGYDVHTASDGIEVLEKIHEVKPDGIILDLIMENFDGDQVIKFLKRNAEYRTLPIIVLSGVIDEGLPQYKDLQADALIQKSDPDTIKKSLKKHLKELFKAKETREAAKKKDGPSRIFADGLIIELLNKSKNFQKILDNLNEGILVTDTDFKIVYANSGLHKILDLPPENVLGRNLKDFLIFLNHRPMVVEDIMNVKGDLEKTKTSELFLHEKILKLKASYFKEENDFSGALVLFTDMTEQKSIEKKMSAEFKQRTAELEKTYTELQEANLELIKASEVKSEFVANVSHELRSPLNDIMGFVQLVQAKIYGPTTEKQDEALRQVMQHSNALLKMINEILDVTKIDKDQMPLITGKIHPRELIEQVIGGYSWIGEAKEIEVQVFYSDNLPSIDTDDTKLKRILINLLDNSVKFTEKGHIYLKAEDLPDEKMVRFTVEDTGKGIPDEYKEIIFEPFRQIDGSYTRKHGGVGLGLYIVKKLTEMINGSISVESEPDKGTTFTVKVPYKMKEEA